MNEPSVKKRWSATALSHGVAADAVIACAWRRRESGKESGSARSSRRAAGSGRSVRAICAAVGARSTTDRTW